MHLNPCFDSLFHEATRMLLNILHTLFSFILLMHIILFYFFTFVGILVSLYMKLYTCFWKFNKNLGPLLFDVSLKLDAWNVNFLKSTIFQYFGTFRMYLRKHKSILLLDFRSHICHNFWCWNHSTLTKLTFSEVQVIVGLSLLKFGSLV